MDPLCLTLRYGLFQTQGDYYYLWDKSHIFVSLQCKEGGFPHDLWLSVSAENVSVYKRGEPKPLETFPYEHIIFFGAPQPCTYKITVDEREMFFETPEVDLRQDSIMMI